MNFYPIEIKFRNASGKWGSITEQAIKVVSPNRIHVEAKLPNGKSYSSTSAHEALDGGNGVRAKLIDYSHPERWTTYTFWVTREELEEILFSCELACLLLLRYDFKGAAGCALAGVENPEEYFCSEFVFDFVLTQWLSNRLNHKMHPDKLEKIVMILESKLLERKFKVEGI